MQIMAFMKIINAVKKLRVKRTGRSANLFLPLLPSSAALNSPPPKLKVFFTSQDRPCITNCINSTPGAAGVRGSLVLGKGVESKKYLTLFI